MRIVAYTTLTLPHIAPPATTQVHTMARFAVAIAFFGMLALASAAGACACQTLVPCFAAGHMHQEGR